MLHSRFSLPALMLLAGLLPVGLADAAVTLPSPFYDNGVTPAQVSNGRTNDADYPIYLANADNFLVADETSLGFVNWSGFYDTNAPHDPDNFSLRIFSVSSGVLNPIPLLDTSLNVLEKVDTGKTVGFLKVYSYTANLTPFALDAGTYALSIFNNTVDGIEWLWGVSSTTGDGSYQTISNPNNWGSLNTGAPEFSFSLSAVPEPASSSLLLVGSVLALARRTRSKNAG